LSPDYFFFFSFSGALAPNPAFPCLEPRARLDSASKKLGIAVPTRPAQICKLAYSRLSKTGVPVNPVLLG